MKLPNFSYEKRFWKRGFKYIVGIDEVGRGAFAGPVVVGAVVFPPDIPTYKKRSLSIGRFSYLIARGFYLNQPLKPTSKVGNLRVYLP